MGVTCARIEFAHRTGSHTKQIVAGPPGSGPGIPSWSPGGTKLAYFYTPGTPGAYNAELWTITADGSHKQRLAASACCVGVWPPPVWSPNGKQIAFAANSAGDTYVVNADGNNLHRISTANARALAWQP
jgi:Tol biopolymer transport system component